MKLLLVEEISVEGRGTGRKMSLSGHCQICAEASCAIVTTPLNTSLNYTSSARELNPKFETKDMLKPW